MKRIEQIVIFEDVDPAEVYDAYMHENRHATFTSSECELSMEVGGKCRMYDGYIETVNVKLEPGKLIEQKWKAAEDAWPEDHWSIIRMELKSTALGTQLKFTHDKVPEELKDSLESGWNEHYWEPMKDYFG